MHRSLIGKNDMVYNNPYMRDDIAKNNLSYNQINQHNPIEFNPRNASLIQNSMDPFMNGSAAGDPRRNFVKGETYHQGFGDLQDVNYRNVTAKGGLSTDKFLSQMGNKSLKIDGNAGLNGQIYTTDGQSPITGNMRVEKIDENKFTSNYGQTKYLAMTPTEKRIRESMIGSVYVDPNMAAKMMNDPHRRSAIDIYTTKSLVGNTVVLAEPIQNAILPNHSTAMTNHMQSVVPNSNAMHSGLGHSNQRNTWM